MRLQLNHALRAALIACYAFAAPLATTLTTGAIVTGVTISLLASQAMADDELTDDNSDVPALKILTVSATANTASMFGSTDYDLIVWDMAATDGLDFINAASNSVCNVDIQIKQMYIDDGNSGRNYTFNGSISDYLAEDGTTTAGHIDFNAWDSGNVNQNYYFQGDMSAWSGDLTAVANSGGYSLNVTVNGAQMTEAEIAASTGVSGTGNITIGGTYGSLSYAFTQDALIANESISVSSLDFSGGANYTLDSEVTASTITIGASTSVENTDSLTVSAGGSLAEGASLVNTGSLSLSGTFSMGEGSLISLGDYAAGSANLAFTGSGSVTASSLTMSGGSLSFGSGVSASVAGTASFSGGTVAGDFSVGGVMYVTGATTFTGNVTGGSYLNYTAATTFDGGSASFDYMTLGSNNNSKLYLLNGAQFELTMDTAYGYGNHLSIYLGDGSTFSSNTTTRIQGGSDWYFYQADGATTGGTLTFNNGFVVAANGTSGTTLTIGTGVDMVVDSSFVIGSSTATGTAVTINGSLTSKVALSSTATGAESGTITVGTSGLLNLAAGLTATTKTAAINLDVNGTLKLGNQADASFDYKDAITVSMNGGSTITDDGSAGGVTVSTSIHYADNATVNFVGSSTGSLTMASEVAGTNLSANISGDVRLTGGADLTAATVESDSTLTIGADATIATTTVNGALVITKGATLTGDVVLNGASMSGAGSLNNSTLYVTSTGNTISSISLENTEVQLQAGSHLTLSNVTIGYGTSIGLADSSLRTEASSATLTLKDVTIDAVAGENLTVNDMNYTVDNIGDGLSTTVEGTLTVNLVLSDGQYDAFTSWLEGGSDTQLTFTLNGVDSYADGSLLVLTFATADTDVYYYVWGDFVTSSDASSGSLVVSLNQFNVIPEPSTATLSLLALAGMLARRRRKSLR